jgi:hypothetical protein
MQRAARIDDRSFSVPTLSLDDFERPIVSKALLGFMYDSDHLSSARAREELAEAFIDLSTLCGHIGRVLDIKFKSPESIAYRGICEFDEFSTRVQTCKRDLPLAALHYDFYPFQDEDLKWYEKQGCRIIKVCAEPGDLVLWDSRQMHYAVYPETDIIRTVIYTCYTPAAWISEEDREKKKEIFHNWEATTHWPHINIHSHGKHMIDGKLDRLEREEPLEKPEITEKLARLAGLKPY